MIISSYVGPRTHPEFNLGAHVVDYRQSQGASLAGVTDLFGLRGTSIGSSVWSVVAVASSAASAYHGYKRNDSVKWAILWGLLGGIAPIITPAVAVAQGFGKRK